MKTFRQFLLLKLFTREYNCYYYVFLLGTHSHVLHLIISLGRILRCPVRYGQAVIASISWRHKQQLFVLLEYSFAIYAASHVRAGVTFFSIFHFPYKSLKSITVSIKFVSKRYDMVIHLCFLNSPSVNSRSTL